MNFPSTGILDNFNRANEGPPPSSSWTTGAGVDGLKVVSNQCVPGTDVAHSFGMNWNVSTYTNLEEYVTIVTKPANGKFLGLAFTENLDGTGKEYYVEIDPVAGTDTIQLFYYNGSTSVQLGSTVNQEVSNGDSLGISRVSGVITVYYKSGAGAWTNIIQASDSSWTTAGYIGLYGNGYTLVLDNFGGGAYVPPATGSGFMTPTRGYWG